jgi:hypothetical protein
VGGVLAFRTKGWGAPLNFDPVRPMAVTKISGSGCEALVENSHEEAVIGLATRKYAMSVFDTCRIFILGLS